MARSVMTPEMHKASTKLIVSVQLFTISKVVPQSAQKFSLHWNTVAKKNATDQSEMRITRL